MEAGLEDGDARRLADQARVKCEGIPALTEGPAPMNSPCGIDSSTTEPPGPKYVLVYFSCREDAADIGSDQHTVYAVQREVPGSATDSVEERLGAAVHSYLAGPNDSEADAGFFGAAPPNLADMHKVTIADDEVAIDFSAAAADPLGGFGTSAAGDAFMQELSTTIFQFDELSSLSLSLDGDCEAFWRYLERGCQQITREEG